MNRISALGVISSLAAWSCTRPAEPELGLTHELAVHRSATVAGLRVDLLFHVPRERSEPVTGTVQLHFDLADASQPLVLDFRAPETNVLSVMLDDTPASYTTPAGHLVIPASALTVGSHAVAVEFVATDLALNRSEDYLYTLFVPDRASTAFPIFDQPDLKARYALSLDLPADWQAVANGSVTSDAATGDHRTLRFRETMPLSTYQVAFAAGRFQVEEAVVDGRAMRMFHRESDPVRVARNRDAIFRLHADALKWLEVYTGIPFPFEKVAFFAVPAFQFGGMEHPGAVYYRASSLFLDESATQNQLLGRASVIAHETAHMWFGDLVTMEWFNDVWMKEVFANFMAAKIVQPAFPTIDHDLRFFLAHHPTAYGVDRTPGANAIRQELENLRDAGALYGAIIYQKAPIVMRQLESLIGEEAMRDGLRRYLDMHRYGNATWSDLIDILDESSPENLRAWSRAWVEEPRRPTVTATWANGALTLHQQDPVPDRDLTWDQRIGVDVGTDGGGITRATVRLAGTDTMVPMAGSAPRFILPGVDGLSYGRFPLDATTRGWLLSHLADLPTPLQRATAWMGLWEEMLDGTVPPAAFLDLVERALPRETDLLVQQRTLGLLGDAFWRFLSAEDRQTRAPAVERLVWNGLAQARTPSAKGAWYNAVVSVSSTPAALDRLESIWRTRRPPPGLPLSEPQYTSLAEQLALKRPERAPDFLDTQARRITNPDRAARFAFVRAALLPDRAGQDSLFATFQATEGRRRESWALDAVRWLNHPLRAPESERFLAPGLLLLQDIQETGDIFFPLNWLNALLDGHQSPEAADAVLAYLDAHPDLPPRLRGKLLQAADDLFRSARLVHGWTGTAPEG